MLPTDADVVLQAAFYAQLVSQSANLDLLRLLIRAVQTRKFPVRPGPTYLARSAIGTTSWHLSIMLFLYYFCPGQSMNWYHLAFANLSSTAAVRALLQASGVQDTVIYDWYWSFGQYNWFKPEAVGNVRCIFSNLWCVAIDKVEAGGVMTDWSPIVSIKDISSRTLSIMMDNPRPDPTFLGLEVFELKLRVPSATTARMFHNIIPFNKDDLRSTLQILVLPFIASTSSSWELMWVYAPRNIAYIARVEWEKLQWLGILLLEKMVQDIITSLGNWSTTLKLNVLTAVLTSKETLAALLCSVGYYGWKREDLPPLETARTHFLALFALSYLTFLDFVGTASPSFSDWFMEGFKPLVQFLDGEFEKALTPSETTPPPPNNSQNSSLTGQRVQSHSGSNTSPHARARTSSLPEPPFPSGRRRALRKVNGRYIPWTAEEVRMEEAREAAELGAKRLRRERSLVHRMWEQISVQWSQENVPDSIGAPSVQGERIVQYRPLKRRRSFAATVSDAASDTLTRLVSTPWPRTLSFSFGVASTSTSSGPSAFKPITATDADSEAEIEDLLQRGESESDYDDTPAYNRRPSLLRSLSSVRSISDITSLISGSPVLSDNENTMVEDDWPQANDTPEPKAIHRPSALKHHSHGIIKSRKEGAPRKR